MYDRSGIVLSSAALAQFVQRALTNETICSSAQQGDAALEEFARCLGNVNVLPGDSRDHLGYHRFLPFHMKDYFIGSLNYSLPHHKYFLDRSYYGLINVSSFIYLYYIYFILYYFFSVQSARFKAIDLCQDGIYAKRI